MRITDGAVEAGVAAMRERLWVKDSEGQFSTDEAFRVGLFAAYRHMSSDPFLERARVEGRGQIAVPLAGLARELEHEAEEARGEWVHLQEGSREWSEWKANEAMASHAASVIRRFLNSVREADRG